jgi:membrane protein
VDLGGRSVAGLTGGCEGYEPCMNTRSDQRNAPAKNPDADPDDSKVDSPDDLSKHSWGFVLRKTMREFSKDQCTDLAAALTYYSVLALFPAVIALTSILGLVGQSDKAVTEVLNIVRDLGGGSLVSSIEPTLRDISSSQSAGLGFVLGLLGALWSASGYVGAFGRAMNRMYEVGEGRPIWKLRPVNLVLTVVLVVLTAVALALLVLTGGIATAVGNALGLGDTVVTVWNIVKWPALLFVVIIIIALLYYATPNVKQPKFRWVSVGAIVAIVVWVLASAAFGFYVSNFSSYDKTYGALAGVIAFLLWLWLTNLALLFGGELDAELERGRELQSGIPAEETVQLPPRDTRNIEKAREKEEEDVRRGRELRASKGGDGDRS